MTLEDRCMFASQVANRIMLANDFQPTLYSPRLYCVQPKLDGVRAMWVPYVGFVSRKGTLFSDALVDHIRPTGDRTLDGELYCHGMAFQDIMSAISPARGSPTEETKRISFHVFDYVSGEKYKQRRRTLDGLQYCGLGHNVCIVETRQETCWGRMFSSLQGYVAMGYEGVMVRCPEYPYTAGRCEGLLRWKAWLDMIVDVIGYQQGEGKYKNTLGALICKIGHTEFNCSGMTDAKRDEFWSKQPTGIKIKIKYLSLSNSGIPLKGQYVYTL